MENNNTIKKLKEILEKANNVEPEQIKKEAAQFLKTIDMNDLVQAEQMLVEEGLPIEKLRHLCPAHIEILSQQQKDIRSTLESSHPIHILMSEHEEILIFLDLLEKLNSKIQKIDQIPSPELIEKLTHIVEHLLGAEKHHQREEDVLFPAIEEKAIVGPTEIMRLEHDQFRLYEKQLFSLITKPKIEKEALKKIDKLSKFIVFNLRDHIFKENNILYPAALTAINSKKEWKNIREKFDKIGYCCFTPQLKSDEQIAILDLRNMPPFERHTKIFQSWEKLSTGSTLRIINDHDPKPLHYQFEAELAGTFEWNYKENGPIDWVVEITKKLNNKVKPIKSRGKCGCGHK